MPEDLVEEVFDQLATGLDHVFHHLRIIIGGIGQSLEGEHIADAPDHRAAIDAEGIGAQDQQKQVKNLSGGERNRVHLAKVLSKGANVILLDEPTNDLDINTLRALEEALEAFAGCAVVVSHDRWFLDRIATHIMAFEDDAQITMWDGNFSDYEAERHKRLGLAADTPHRYHYRSLTR